MRVTFYEKGHKYLNDLGAAYTSATTLLGKYKEPFDADYWSTYKAVERIITKRENEFYWQEWKRSVGYKNVIDSFMADADEYDIELLKTTKEMVLKDWDYERDIACFNGSNFHLAKEKGWLEKPKHYEGVIKRQWYTTGVQNVKGENISPEDLPDGIYSELVLWNHFYEIAGQADIVYIETIDGVRYVDIDDYKTNKEIKTESYMNPRTRKYKMMKRPLGNIMDCNGSHYELQISLYAWFLEQFGYVVRNLNFQHWNNVGTKEDPKYDFAKDYPLKYRKKEIEKVLEHFRNKR
jgi:hypothetical protein